MKFSDKLLISPEQDIKMSSIYVGYIILKFISNHKKITIFNIFAEIKSKGSNYSYGNVMHALIFLYMNGLIDFDEPYIYNLQAK